MLRIHNIHNAIMRDRKSSLAHNSLQNRLPFWAIGMLGAVSLAACASNQTPLKGHVAGPALWCVADADSKIYLFGTFHILPKDVEWTSAAYAAAMADAETTIVETDTRSPKAISTLQEAAREYGLNPPGITLSQTLGAERAGRFFTFAEEVGAQRVSLEEMRPWLALISLTQIVFQQNGFDPSLGVEAAVLDQAVAEGDSIEHLETAAFQIRTLADLDREEMFANFDTTIDQLADFKTVTGRLLEAWRTGDLDGIETDVLVDLRMTSPNAFKIIFAARNETWANRVETLLNDDKDYFVAVGIGHLVGEQSVIERLNERGRKVKRIQ